MIEAALFDLDDTLHDDTLAYRRAARSVADEIAAERGVSAQRLYDAYVAEAESFWKALSPATLGTPLVGIRAQMWLSALRTVGLDEQQLAERCGTEYNRFRREYLVLWPGVVELLTDLRAAGCKLAMITNGFSETHRDKIATLALEDSFDEIFIADEVGMVKPDPRLFRLAAERLGVEPGHCAMIGDRYDRDVRGGHDAGMFTVWVNVRDERVPEGAPAPDAIVAGIGEVAGVLARLRAPV